jgi:hypothetical protein
MAACYLYKHRKETAATYVSGTVVSVQAMKVTGEVEVPSTCSYPKHQLKASA